MNARKWLFGLVLLSFLGSVQTGEAGAFDNSDLNGTYVMTLNGHGQVVNLPPDPCAVLTNAQSIVGIGIVTFDGDGNIPTGSIRYDVNGDCNSGFVFGGTSIVPRGFYSVNSDGTCTMTLPQGPIGRVLVSQWSCILESDKTVQMIGNNTSVKLYNVVQATLTKQNPKH